MVTREQQVALDAAHRQRRFCGDGLRQCSSACLKLFDIIKDPRDQAGAQRGDGVEGRGGVAQFGQLAESDDVAQTLQRPDVGHHR